MAPSNGTQQSTTSTPLKLVVTLQWHPTMAPSNGTTSTAPCNGTLVPRPIRQSGSSPSPLLEVRTPIAIAIWGPPSGHLWISPHVKGCIVQVSSHVLQGPKGWANSIGWDETWRLFWDVNITWSWKLTSHWVFLAVLVVAVLLDQTFNWGFEKTVGYPYNSIQRLFLRCLPGTWRNKLLRLSVAFVNSPRDAHFIH